MTPTLEGSSSPRDRHPDRASLSLYHDGEGPPELHHGVQAHLDRCAECRAVLAELEALSRAFRDLPELSAPSSVLEGFRRTLDPPQAVTPGPTEGASPAGHGAEPVPRVEFRQPPTIDPLPSFSRWGPRLAAVVAIGVTLVGIWAYVPLFFEGPSREVARHDPTDAGAIDDSGPRFADEKGARDKVAEFEQWRTAPGPAGAPADSEVIPGGVEVRGAEVLRMQLKNDARAPAGRPITAARLAEAERLLGSLEEELMAKRLADEVLPRSDAPATGGDAEGSADEHAREDGGESERRERMRQVLEPRAVESSEVDGKSARGRAAPELRAPATDPATADSAPAAESRSRGLRKKREVAGAAGGFAGEPADPAADGVTDASDATAGNDATPYALRYLASNTRRSPSDRDLFVMVKIPGGRANDPRALLDHLRRSLATPLAAGEGPSREVGERTPEADASDTPGAPGAGAPGAPSLRRGYLGIRDFAVLTPLTPQERSLEVPAYELEIPAHLLPRLSAETRSWQLRALTPVPSLLGKATQDLIWRIPAADDDGLALQDGEQKAPDSSAPKVLRRALDDERLRIRMLLVPERDWRY